MKRAPSGSEQQLLMLVNERVKRLCQERDGIRLMEVCGTHTMAISASGIRRAVDPRLKLLSGPGCPVCVTTDAEIDTARKLAERQGLVVVTFGDMIRVPGSLGSLAEAKAEGADIRVVYSPQDGLKMAMAEPEKEFVFLGVGFETTAPTVAATVLAAAERRVENFSVLTMFKLIPPALEFIASAKKMKIDGFILPGHVSTIIGSKPYEFLVQRFGLPCCITGFEPADILEGILLLLEQLEHCPRLAIQYRRSVRPEGNRVAQQLINDIFEVTDAEWRGIGRIRNSGLRLKPDWQKFDARVRFGLRSARSSRPASGCRCGEVLLGLMIPSECRLFGRVCTPETPKGPCMVSSEGACAAYYRYER
ncbi:MAG: hydrogenase formation protein HypD [candidate division WOR-3 bacterium]